MLELLVLHGKEYIMKYKVCSGMCNRSSPKLFSVQSKKGAIQNDEPYTQARKRR
jgi:hypothetical protein